MRAIEVLPAGKWPAHRAIDRLVLTYDERHRRRLRYVAEGGTTFLLDLPRAAVLRAGDGLRLEDGRIISVNAAPEHLVEITAPDPATLTRLAWHIGNRHLPAQLEPQRILIREDAVIVKMLTGLGATVSSVLEPFTPEPGAYDTGAERSRHETHNHGHERPHEHRHTTDQTRDEQHSHNEMQTHTHEHDDAYPHERKSHEPGPDDHPDTGNRHDD
jgi:urease accessory protein